MSSPPSKKPIAAIILCAGKGRRMQAPRTPKVCFPIVGKAAIVHMLVLAREDAADSVIERMNRLYYEPRGLEPGAMVFVPIAGCSPLTLPSSCS